MDKEVVTLTEEKTVVMEEGSEVMLPTAAARNISLLEETKFHYHHSINLFAL